MTRPIFTQHEIDLIRDERVFNPDPVRIEAPWWLEPLCAVLLVVIAMATAAVIGCPVGWLVG